MIFSESSEIEFPRRMLGAAGRMLLCVGQVEAIDRHSCCDSPVTVATAPGLRGAIESQPGLSQILKLRIAAINAPAQRPRVARRCDAAQRRCGHARSSLPYHHKDASKTEGIS
jgi:hypothetical protein